MVLVEDFELTVPDQPFASSYKKEGNILDDVALSIGVKGCGVTAGPVTGLADSDWRVLGDVYSQGDAVLRPSVRSSILAASLGLGEGGVIRAR